MLNCIPQKRSESLQSEDSDYDELKFLKVAIGEEVLRAAPSAEYLFARTESIGTEDCSALLTSRSNISYEEAPNLAKDIDANIYETTKKVLNYGLKKMPHFIGSPAHLEGEKLLQLCRAQKEHSAGPGHSEGTCARILLRDLKITLKTPEETHSSTKPYYFCILRHNADIYSTRVAAPLKQGVVNLGGFFAFNICKDFCIKVQLFHVNLRERPQNCIALCSKPRLKFPLMCLAGETCINASNLKNRIPIGTGDFLEAISEVHVDWPQAERGFLTIGTGKSHHLPLWNRRWCVLEGAQLKYYNYPSDEAFSKPLGAINFLSYSTCTEDNSNKYLGQKTLCLSSESEFKRILISPDGKEEYKAWLSRFSNIINLIRDWNGFIDFGNK